MGQVIEISPGAPPALVTVVKRGAVHRITLSNGPANALSLALMDALLVALDDAKSDEECRVVVLAAAGPAFCAGHDLVELAERRGGADGGGAFFEAAMRLSSGLMQAIVRHPRPVVAEVAGAASGAGCELVASCDLAIAAETATFAVPDVNFGLFPSMAAVALSRNIARKHAMEMLLTGETIDARTAREFGIVNRVVPPEYLTTVVEKYAASIAAKAPDAIRRGKEAFYDQAEMGLATAYEHAAAQMAEGLAAPEAGKGLGEFLAGSRSQGKTP